MKKQATAKLIIDSLLKNPTSETLVEEGIRVWNEATGSNLVLCSNVQKRDLGNWVNSETWRIEVRVEYESVRKNHPARVQRFDKRQSRKQVWAKLIDEQIGRFTRAVNSLGIEGVYCTSFKNHRNHGSLHLNLKNPMPFWKKGEYIETTDENKHPIWRAHTISLFSYNVYEDDWRVSGDCDSFHYETKSDNETGGE